MVDRDEAFMREALEEARAAEAGDEVPAGAVVVSSEGEIIGRGGNACISRNDPTAHAEIIALRRAGRQVGNYRLLGAHVFTTLEPCPMCMMAMIHARVHRLVYGAAEPRWGAGGSLIDLPGLPGLNHQLEVVGGVLEDECQELIRSFFRRRRGAGAVERGRLEIV